MLTIPLTAIAVSHTIADQVASWNAERQMKEEEPNKLEFGRTELCHEPFASVTEAGGTLAWVISDVFQSRSSRKAYLNLLAGSSTWKDF